MKHLWLTFLGAATLAAVLPWWLGVAPGWAALVCACGTVPVGTYVVRQLLRRVERDTVAIATRWIDGVSPSTHWWPESRQVDRAMRSVLGSLESDAADRKNALELSERGAKVEAEYLRSLSHELRTPLNAIAGFVHVLSSEMDGPLSPSQREDVNAIEKAAQRLNELIEDVISLVQMQSPAFELKREEVNVREIISEVKKELEGINRKSDVQIKSLIETQAVTVNADPRRLRQMLVNLGTNALKFTRTGSVTLAATETPLGVELSVTDTGQGIEESKLEALFEPFERNTRWRRNPDGSGLGLFIVQKLAKLHGAKLTASSKVNRGSCFAITFPIRRRGHNPYPS